MESELKAEVGEVVLGEGIETQEMPNSEKKIHKLNDKFNVKFTNICQIFENCIKAKTKCKIK
jgi:hypothetical protein